MRNGLSGGISSVSNCAPGGFGGGGFGRTSYDFGGGGFRFLKLIFFIAYCRINFDQS